MAHIFCVANQKGGVGKTTTTVNLSAGLAALGQRVLMVDLDPQGNATMGSGVDKRELELSVYEVLIEGASIAQAKVVSHWGEQPNHKQHKTYDVLGASRELAGAELELVGMENREKRLTWMFSPILPTASANRSETLMSGFLQNGWSSRQISS